MALPSPQFIAESNHQPISVKPQQNMHKSYNVQKQFDCKVCVMKFPSQNDLFSHRRLHEQCPFDGCKFNALENVVSAHFQRAHTTQPKVQDLSTPEDIEKWRQERRKRYPTVANVLLRQQIKIDKNERGENIQKAKNKRFGDARQRNSNPRDNKRHKNHHQNDRNHKFIKKEVVKEMKVEEEEEKVRQMPKFQGIGKPSQPAGALSLLGQYSSDSDDEEVTPKVETKPICISNIDDNEEPIEESIKHVDEHPVVAISPPKPRHTPNLKRKPINQGSLLDYSKLRRTSANPLLEKLLQSDIEHERNVILQCCRFIVKSNFFGFEQNENK